jgi:Mrp family chromosome partitioning ATPase
VVSRATVSNIPAYPKKLPTVLIATFATLVLSSGLIMTREILSAPDSFVPLRSSETAFASDGLAPRVAAIVNEPRWNEPSAASPSSIASVADNLRHAGAAAGRLAVFSAVPGLNSSQAAIRLGRTLAEDSRVVLIGLASSDTAIRGISNEPSAGGLAELARGAASFGTIITKDRLSPLHLIISGQAVVDRIDILSAPGMVAKFNALARSYDHVLVDAGPVAGPEIERIAEIAPHAVLVTDSLSNAATASARERLLASGFGDVRIFAGGGLGAETAVAA